MNAPQMYPSYLIIPYLLFQKLPVEYSPMLKMNNTETSKVKSKSPSHMYIPSHSFEVIIINNLILILLYLFLQLQESIICMVYGFSFKGKISGYLKVFKGFYLIYLQSLLIGFLSPSMVEFWVSQMAFLRCIYFLMQ